MDEEGGRKSRSVGIGRYRRGREAGRGPRGGGEYEGDPDEEWKEERARGERGRAVKAGGEGGRTRRARRV